MQTQESAAQVDLASYDRATLTVTSALFSRDDCPATLADVPVLPVAPWNRKPGYLVSCRLIAVACSMPVMLHVQSVT